MDQVYTFISLFFLSIFILGRFLDQLKIPWIFSALLIGLYLSSTHSFAQVTGSETFVFLSELGMYFLLFIIGFEVDLKELKKHSIFVFKLSFWVTFANFLVLLILFYYFFNYSLLVSSLVAFSFSTVGEAVLVPILDKQKIIKTKLGQLLISLGAIDDIFEILFFVLVTLIIGNPNNQFNKETMIYAIVGPIIALLIFSLLKKNVSKFKTMELEAINLVLFFLLFFAIALGSVLEAASLGALMAGVISQTFIPKERLQEVEKQIKMICYGFFAPFFFLKIGLDVDLGSIFVSWSAVIIIFLFSAISKLIPCLVSTRKLLNYKEAAILGTGLSVRFSTGLVILTMLLQAGLIDKSLFSIVMGANMLSLFVVPLLFTYLINLWSNEINNNE